MHFTDNGQLLKPVARWGRHNYTVTEHPLHTCRSISEGKVAMIDMPGNNARPCEHIHIETPYVSICMPLLGQNEKLGMINLLYTTDNQKLSSREKAHMLSNWRRLATTAADNLAMAIANMKLREELQELSIRDGLTGLFNRRYMEESLSREFIQAERSKKPVGIIIMDVDFFKKFNDTYGHHVGDVVLVKLGKLLSNNIRKGDIVCRYGGEEFLIILPGASLSKIIQRAEMLRDKVEKELRIEHNGECLPITISLGAAAYPDHGSSPEEVIKIADNALYKAKDQGRNMVVYA
jgi:diguanylate cyclase (GGDEF)-like protein